MAIRFTVDQEVYKRGAGYEGPGFIAAVFKAWSGDYRYVVAHRIAGGRGFFYHIYSAKELQTTDEYEPSEWPAVRQDKVNIIEDPDDRE